MVFNPTLESTPGYSRPVEAPNALGAVASLFDNLGAFNKPKEPAKLTQDEQFAQAWDAFSSAQGSALNPTNGNYNQNLKTLAPAFLRQFPQFGPQVNSMLDASGVALPMDTQTYAADEEFKAGTKMALDFKFSPRGQIADMQARTYATDENGNFNPTKYNEYYNKEHSRYLTTQAEITALSEQASIVENRDKVGSSYWKTGKDFANTYVTAQLGGLQDLLIDIQDGTAEVTPEMADMLGIKAGPLKAENLWIAMQGYRPRMAQMLKEATAAELVAAGADPDVLSTVSPDEAWFGEVMAPIDQLIKIAESDFGSVSATLKTLQDGDMLKTLQTIKTTDPDLYSRLQIAQAMPPELRSSVYSLFSERSDGWNAVANTLTLEFTAGGVTPDKTTAKVSDMSKEDATAATEFSIGTLEAGKPEGDVLRNATTTFFVGKNRVAADEFIGYDTFKSITKNAEGIAQEAAADPIFKSFVEENLLSDLNKNFKALTLQIQGNPNLSIKMDNGKLVVVSSGGQMVTGMTGAAVDQSTVEFNNMEVQRIMESPEFIGLQNKLNDMKAFGDVGSTVSEAFGMENGLISQGQDQVKGSAGADTLAPVSGNGPIAQRLGIDFAGVEQMYGLPSGFLERTAMIESSGNPEAKNPNSTAGGLFQQLDSNAKAYGVKNKFDPVQSTEGAAKFAADNARILRGVLGREPTGGELYLAHQQGPGGATKLLTNPSAMAVDIVGEETIRLNGGNVNMTAGEFANIWISKFNGARGPVSYVEATGNAPLTAQTSPPVNPVYLDKEAMNIQTGVESTPIRVQTEVGGNGTTITERPVEEQKASSEAAKANTQAVNPEVQALIQALVQGGKLKKGEVIKIGDQEIEVA